MPKATCQLNLTLEIPVAEHVEKIAREANLRPSGAGRVLLEQRLALETSGWKIESREMGTLIEAICRLREEDLQSVKELLRGIVAKRGSDEGSRAASDH
jgi:hypothetical protein